MIKYFKQLFFLAGSQDMLMAVANNDSDIFLITFDLETVTLKEQLHVGPLEDFIEAYTSDESDQILIVYK